MYIKKITKQVIVLLIVIISISLVKVNISNSMVASGSNSQIPKKTIIVGDDLDYPPFSFLDNDNNPTGFNIELMKAVGEVMGFEVEFQLDNWNETIEKLINEEVDVVSGMFFSQERENEFDFSVNHSVASGDIFTRNNQSIDSIQDLNNSTVVVQTNDIMHEFLLNEDLNISFVEVPTIKDALFLVSNGQYDYAAGLKPTGHYLINKHNLNLKSNGLLLDSKEYSMAVKSGNSSILNTLNEGLFILNTTGQYRDIYNEWLGIYEEPQGFNFIKFLWIILIGILLLFGLFLWNVILRKLVSSRTKELMQLNFLLQENKMELTASNEELEASVGQLVATEEELRTQYDHLKESEDRYRKLVTEMHQGLALHEVVLDDESKEVIDYIFIDVNDSFERLTGLNREHILGKRVTEVFPNTGVCWIKKFGNVALTGEVIHLEKFNEDLNKHFEAVAYKPKYMQFAVIIMDITERKRTEKLIRTNEENFRMLFEGSSDPIFLIDGYKIIDCNLATVTTFGYDSKNEIIDKSPWDISPEKQSDNQLSEEKAVKIIKSAYEEGKVRFEWSHQRKDKTLLIMDVIISSITVRNKKHLHVLCRDITDRKDLEQKLQYLSYHDQLTGLYNRRFFENELKRLNHQSALPLSIVMADVNGLKLINDAFGHSTGDKLLQKVAAVLTKGVRTQDLVARLGGDEFVILLPNTEASDAEEIVKRLKTRVSEQRIESLNLSVSFGISTKLHKKQKIHEILTSAEDDMYKKKLYESPSIRSKNINIIMNTLNERSSREEAHSHRVSELCESIGKALDFSDEKILELKAIGLLHDIGKIAIDGDILNKAGKLTEEEWKEIKRHPEIGYRLLSSVNEMSDIADYVLAHHEKWDGTGYPKGLKGEEIPLSARIIAIADAYDAMTSERSYRKPLTHSEAIEELKRCSGSQFDPKLVEVFANYLNNH